MLARDHSGDTWNAAYDAFVVKKTEKGADVDKIYTNFIENSIQLWYSSTIK